MHSWCAGKRAEPLADLPRWRLEAMLGTWVRQARLYRLALTAPAAVADPVAGSFERLEYLGDAVLATVARGYVYTKCGLIFVIKLHTCLLVPCCR
jgi:hypothetical protein